MHRRVALLLVAGCHVHGRTETLRPEHTERTPNLDAATALRPTLVVSEVGTLRFVEPLQCPTEEVITNQRAVELSTGPNLATFIVGVIATGVGGILLARGATSDDAVGPTTLVGGVGVAIGVPLAIGPFVGNHTVIEPGAPATPTRRPGPSVACGARGFAARAATLIVRGVEVHGAVAEDGTFSVSPFALVDAFEPGAVPAWEVSGTIDADGGARPIDTVIEASALVTHAAAYLAHADFDAKIEPMRLVPGIVAGTLRASLTSTATGPALRIVLPIKNDGPGPAFALRGHVTSTTKAVDGRVVYFGHVARGGVMSRELIVPLAEAAAATLRGAALDLSIELRDAHGTAPATPIRYRGAVFGDAPR